MAGGCTPLSIGKSQARKKWFIFIDVAVVCSDSWLIQNGSELHTKCGLWLISSCIRWHKTTFASRRLDDCEQQHINWFGFSFFFFVIIFFFSLFSVFNYIFFYFVASKPTSPKTFEYSFPQPKSLSAFVCRAKFIARTNTRKCCLSRQKSFVVAVQNALLIFFFRFHLLF